RFRLALHGAEGTEIVLAEQRLRRQLHALRVQRLAYPGGAARVPARAHPAVEDDVAVTARHGAEAGVEILRHGARPVEVDIRRQVAVRAQHPAALGADRLGIEMRDLVEGMHAGIGAAGADQFHRMIGNAGKRLLDPLLHAVGMALLLPAAVGAAVVFDAYRHSHRQCSPSRIRRMPQASSPAGNSHCPGGTGGSSASAAAAGSARDSIAMISPAARSVNVPGSRNACRARCSISGRAANIRLMRRPKRRPRGPVTPNSLISAAPTRGRGRPWMTITTSETMRISTSARCTASRPPAS